jgi:hypothetical protein
MAGFDSPTGGWFSLPADSLKSNGDTIAELRIPKGTALSFSGNEVNYDINNERQTAKGDVTIWITHAGGSPVVVKADEIEAVPDRQ